MSGSGSGSEQFEKWIAKIAWLSILGLVASNITWATWITRSHFALARQTPTKLETIELVNEHGPYNRDQKYLTLTIQNNTAAISKIDALIENKLSVTVQNNTQAMIKLESVVANLESLMAAQRQRERESETKGTN